VLLAVVEDLLGRYRPDSGQRVELFHGRDVQMDGPGGHRAGSLTASCGRRRGANRNDHLRPVCKRRSEIDQREVGAPGRSAGTRDGVRDTRPLREAVETGPPDGSDDVDDQLGPLVR